VLEEARRVADGSDESTYRLDVMKIADPAETLHVRIADSFPGAGWGGWLARLRLERQTG
jgi:hypothetical protein